MSDFADRLSALVSKEMAEAHGDQERIGIIIERLIHSAAFTIAIAAEGNAKGMETLLHGADAYLYEAATDHAKVGQLMASARGRP